MVKRMKKLATMAIASGVAATPILGVVPVAMAADTDTIDMTKTATLEIHKYDEVAAKLAGVDVDSLNMADGEKDEDVESAMAKYALQGVQFKYLKVGDIITDTDAATSSTDASVEVVYSVNTNLLSILGLDEADARKVSGNKYCFSSSQINTALADKLENDYLATKDAIEDYINDNKGVAMDDTDANGVTSKSGLELGLYLIVETEVPEEVTFTVDPFFVSLPMTDATGDYWIEDGNGNYKVTVYPKNQTDIPTIEKVVRQVNNEAKDAEDFADTTTASEGDRLEYRITSRVPVVSTDASNFTQWEYVDKIVEGITYDQTTGVSIRFYDTEELATSKASTPNVNWSFGKEVVVKSAYDQASASAREGIYAYVDYSTDGTTMTVSLTPAGLEAVNADTDTINPNTGTSNSQYQGKYLTLCYAASVDSNDEVILGDTGNENDVTLTYKRTNTDYYETIKDVANVYTYGIDLTKEFEDALDEGHDASEVQFVLKNSEDGHYIVAKPVTDSKGTVVPGEYYVTDKVDVTEEEDASVFSPSTDGKIIINGLEAGTYVMTEIQTVDGFSLLKDDITIVINMTEDSITASEASRTGIPNDHSEVIYQTGDRATASVDDQAAEMNDGSVSTNEYVVMKVINNKDFTLPKTGGLGTLIFSAIAAAGGLTGVGFVMNGKKKKTVG